MTLKSLKQRQNKSIKLSDELCHDSLKHFPVSSSLNRYPGANTNTIPPIEGERRQDLALSASPILIRDERTPGSRDGKIRDKRKQWRNDADESWWDEVLNGLESCM